MVSLTTKEFRLISLLTLDTVFFFLEITIGYMSKSLALIADSFHMLNDIISLLVALWAVNVSKNRNPDAKYTYGWKRAEILGALINAVFLIALCFTIFIEALQRLLDPPTIENPKLVLIVGIAGLCSNILGLAIFHDHGHSHGHSHSDSKAHGHAHIDDESSLLEREQSFYQGGPSPSSISMDHSNNNIHDIWPQSVVERYSTENTGLLDRGRGNGANAVSQRERKKSQRSLNMHGVFLHVAGDALGNIGVIIAGLAIWKTNFSWKQYTDPVVSLLITGIVFSTALPLSRKSSRILLQATPSTISADEVKDEVLHVPGVLSVHDFHIWNLTESLYIASIHVQINSTPSQFVGVAKAIRNIFHNHGIHSATVQPEFVDQDAGPNTSSRETDVSALASSGQPSDVAPQSAYGATSVGSHCLVDKVANCNADNCLHK
ncbi:BN860_13762g1_1 [Zygosaccharomyces bailii CLIB 213]|uniref:BN860_13762g1_1 n=1 Tax=Zygosaccharomyces bailii (strain CLIB 213 / ATCC 58445 / CBS 680 / BCRC 21525 / NBRC 1098 / NCYC 1416 / NRRL Y-2227) TaxID=1333698 RepID=A0A8J2X7F6_ZYGB2|nr:BN860_13762g1_1 [Zygosaccharomyces bailii CLIB 213]